MTDSKPVHDPDVRLPAGRPRGGYRHSVRTDGAIRAGVPAPGGATTHVLSVGLMVCAVYVVFR